MIDYSTRSSKKEYLDQTGISFRDIAANMQELEFINKWLGGHSISVAGFRELLQQRKAISVCEIGCGGGDNLKMIYNFCKRKKVNLKLTGIDINKECIAFARRNTGIENVEFMVSDYREVSFEEQKPDIIFSSLFCHHFTNEELVDMLQWMKENSITGFFINDLHRHPFAYNFIKAVTQIFSKSYLVRNDAPLSVLRGFKKKEWEKILKQAGIKNYQLSWKWAFRYLIISRNAI